MSSLGIGVALIGFFVVFPILIVVIGYLVFLEAGLFAGRWAERRGRNAAAAGLATIIALFILACLTTKLAFLWMGIPLLLAFFGSLVRLYQKAS